MSRQPDRVRQLFAAIDEQRPTRETTRTSLNAGSYRTVIQRQAIADADLDEAQAIELDQWWFPEEGYVVFDLGDAEVLR